MLMSAATSSFFFAPVRSLVPALSARAPAPSAPVTVAPSGAATPMPAADMDCHAHQTYWPCELLNAFVLRMAAQGHCVNMSMMLGHRPYALERLALAADVPDGELQALSAQLRPYFEAPVLTAESAA